MRLSLTAKIERLEADLLASQAMRRKFEKESERLGDFNCKAQLTVEQLKAQRDVLIASLADAQRRIQVLRMKLRPCSHGCGSGVDEEDSTGWPVTDGAAERLA